MTARAHVEKDLLLDGVRIHMADTTDHGIGIVLHFDDVVYERIEDRHAAANEHHPLKLREDYARALYEALARYFGGAPDMAQLRVDYNDERKRVDRLIGFLAPHR